MACDPVAIMWSLHDYCSYICVMILILAMRSVFWCFFHRCCCFMLLLLVIIAVFRVSVNKAVVMVYWSCWRYLLYFCIWDIFCILMLPSLVYSFNKSVLWDETEFETLSCSSGYVCIMILCLVICSLFWSLQTPTAVVSQNVLNHRQTLSGFV